MRRSLFSLLFTALLGGFFFSAHAEMPASVTTADEAASPRHQGHTSGSTLAIGATLDPNGRIWLVRVENQRLLVARSEDHKTFSAPTLVMVKPEAIMADGENRPKIVVAAAGTLHVTWVRALRRRYSGEVRYARSVDGGATFSVPVTLNDDGLQTSHRFESLATDGRDKVAVVWLDARDRDAAAAQGRPYPGVSVYVAESNDNGAHFAPNRRLAEHTCECCRTDLTWTPDGPVAFWRNLYQANTRDFAFANLDRGPVRRATDDDWQIDACPHHGGGIASDGVGALHLVWFTQGKARQGLFYRRIDRRAWTAPMAIGNPAAQAGHPAVAAAGSTVLLVWREFDGRVYSAWAQRSLDGGSHWAAPRRVADAVGAADYPVPLTDGKRSFLLWNAAVEGLRVLALE
jgi:hypothetical protein